MPSNFKNIEREVLKAFTEEPPSIYFSDKSAEDYKNWRKMSYDFFHDLLNFPPKLFEGQTLCSTYNLISNKLNCDLVDVIGFNKHKKDLLSKMGFLDKKTGNFGFLVKNSNSEIENILFNDENTLDMSLTDGDAVFSL